MIAGTTELREPPEREWLKLFIGGPERVCRTLPGAGDMANNLTSLCLSLLICKMGYYPQGFCKESVS